MRRGGVCTSTGCVLVGQMKRRIIEALLVRVAAESERLGRCTEERCAGMMKEARCRVTCDSRGR